MGAARLQSIRLPPSSHRRDGDMARARQQITALGKYMVKRSTRKTLLHLSVEACSSLMLLEGGTDFEQSFFPHSSSRFSYSVLRGPPSENGRLGQQLDLAWVGRRKWSIDVFPDRLWLELICLFFSTCSWSSLRKLMRGSFTAEFLHAVSPDRGYCQVATRLDATSVAEMGGNAWALNLFHVVI